jgi:hypothetical protein
MAFMSLGTMAPEIAALDRLNWSAPEAPEGCSFGAAGWSCRSTGFLWFSEVRDGSERLYPCPRCNTELFLAKSRQRFLAEREAAECVCCGPGLARLNYQSALDEARLQTELRLGAKGVAESAPPPNTALGVTFF